MMLRPRQTLFVERSLAALDTHGNTLGVAPTGCHAPGTPILMFDGSIRPVETIRVGDLLMGPDSTPRTVLELHRGEDAMVEVRPIKGDPFTVNAGHVLTLVKINEGCCGSHAHAKPGGTIIDISVAAYRQRSAYFRHLHKLFRVAVEFPPRPVPSLDPYFLGLLIGDGRLAYGTERIGRVDKIVGPGNRYVATAKRLEFGQVGIDMIAGPSEILIVCDGQTDPDWIALDLFSQAEHDEDAQSVLVSPDRVFLDRVAERLAALLPHQPRRGIIGRSLSPGGALFPPPDPARPA